jgi:hypothetical protein
VECLKARVRDLGLRQAQKSITIYAEMLSRIVLSVAALAVCATANQCEGGEWDAIVVGMQDFHIHLLFIHIKY